MDKLTEKQYEDALQEYIDEGINWGACKNSVIQANHGDVEQFAADSFHAGVCFVLKKYNIEWSR